MAATILDGLAVLCLIDAAFVALLAWRRCAGERAQPQAFGLAGFVLCCAAICAIAGSLA